jgi:hypothetical protein
VVFEVIQNKKIENVIPVFEKRITYIEDLPDGYDILVPERKPSRPLWGMALWGISQDEDFGDLLLPIVNPEEIDRLLPFCQNLRSMKFASIPYHIRDRGVFVRALFILYPHYMLPHINLKEVIKQYIRWPIRYIRRIVKQ